MRKLIFIVLFALVFIAGCIIYAPQPYDEPSPQRENYYQDEYAGESYEGTRDSSYFYNYLSPYGYWTSHIKYGYVWIPYSTGYGWRPYSQGRWMWTDYGWTWISDFEWGWAPFHYGRWGWDDYTGWYWEPGTQWGPAWVTWRRGSTYLGWAPIPPGVIFVSGTGIRSLPNRLPDSLWIFVEGRYFYNTHLNKYVLPRERNLTIINYTVQKTNIVMRERLIINNGIDINHVNGISRQRVTKHRLANSANAGKAKIDRGRIEIFKPVISKNETASPKTLIDRNKVKEKIYREKIRKSGVSEAEWAVQKKQAQERELEVMEKSQKMEILEIKKKIEVEKRSDHSIAEKNKVEKKYKEKSVKLKEQHKKEKSRLKQRHEKEKTKVNKKKVKKEVKKQVSLPPEL